MPRTKSVRQTVVTPPSDQIRWVNNGGTFYTRNRVKVARGETFLATPDEIPVAFRSTLRPVDPAELTALESRPVQAAKFDFKVKQRAHSDFYDVLDSSGKRINEKDLTKEEAESVLSMLLQ